MDDIKLFAKNEKELDTLIQTIEIFSQDIGMGFVMEKCAMLMMKSDKRQTLEWIVLPHQERIRTYGEKKNYKYWWILETDIIKQAEIKEKIEKEYF